VQFRFRFGTDDNTTSEADIRGWFVDDVELMDLVIYEVKACVANENNENGTCTETKKYIMNSDGIVNTKDEILDFNYKIAPNPANDYFVIDINTLSNDRLNLEISNIEGKVVFSKSLNTNGNRILETINTSNLTSGMYLVKISNGSQSSTNKVIVR
jgi:hypothetical protein